MNEWMNEPSDLLMLWERLRRPDACVFPCSSLVAGPSELCSDALLGGTDSGLVTAKHYR